MNNTLIDRIPTIWTNWLFPPQAAGETRWRLGALLLLIVLPGLLLYPTREFRLLEPDEGRYAEIGREMFEAGTWVVPTLQGEPYLDKPPLFYWLVKLSYNIFGVSEAAARLVPALAVHLTILMLYLVGRRSVGERAAFWGALTLSILPGFMAMGRLILLDGLLTLTVTLEMLFLYEAIRAEKLKVGWWYAAAAVSGFGVLTKGPIALLLVIPPLVLHRWLTRSQRRAGTLHVIGYGLVLFAINLPWYVAIYLKQPVFLKYFFWEHNVMRFVKPFDHLQPVWYYLPVIILGFLPCLVFARSFLRWLLDETAKGRSPAVGFWLLAGGWCLFFFSCSGSKLPTYILPAFPPLALVFGAFLANTPWRERLQTRFAFGSCAAVLFAAFAVGLPYYAEQRSPLRDEETVRRVCSDPSIPVVCYPRHCDSVAFYLKRNDFQVLRAKESNDLLRKVLEAPTTVVLFTHDHSLGVFEPIMPDDIYLKERVSMRKPKGEMTWLDKLMGSTTPWGLCDLAVIRHKRGWGLHPADGVVQRAEVGARD